MVGKSMKKFAKALKENKPDEAEELIEEVIQEKEKTGGMKNIKNLDSVGAGRAEKIKEHGYQSVENLAKASVKDLEKIPKIGKKSAEKIRESAGQELQKKFEKLASVGPDKAEKIRKAGYFDFESLANASVEDLVEIPKIGEETAGDIIESAKKIRGEEKRMKAYRQALKGAVEGLESERVLTLPYKIATENYSKERIKNIREEVSSRASEKFRPSEERGFNEAWAEILESMM